MSQKVEISKSSLAALVVGLVVCLVGLAFLLGRQSATPVAAVTPVPAAPMVIAASTPSAPTVEEHARPDQAMELPSGFPVARTSERPRRSTPARRQQAATSVSDPVMAAAPEPAPVRREVVVERPAPVPQAVSRPVPTARTRSSTRPSSTGGGSASATASAPARDKAVDHYFEQIDAAMAGTAALDDPNGFATELLQKSMNGDNSGFDSLIASSQATLSKVQAIKAPASCAAHHSLLVSQLQDSLGLLRQVKGATTSLDTSSLASLSQRGSQLQSSAKRLAEMEQKLRK